MNPKSFLGMMSDISDEYIVSAAKPHSKPIRWYPISAVAACIVLLICAAIYSKLRVETPEIMAPPSSPAEITAATTTEPAHPAETQTTAVAILTEITSIVSVSGITTVPTTAAETDVPLQSEMPSATVPTHTIQSASTAPTQSAPSVSTTAFAGTTVSQTTTTYGTTAAPASEPIPLWKGDVLIASGAWFEMPELACMFRYFPPEQNEILREEFSIPQEVDLTLCLLMTVQTGYADTAIVGCKYAQNGLIVQIAYLETGAHAEQTMRFAIPIPENLLTAPENCSAEFIPMTDETEYQALLTDSLYIETIE